MQGHMQIAKRYIKRIDKELSRSSSTHVQCNISLTNRLNSVFLDVLVMFICVPISFGHSTWYFITSTQVEDISLLNQSLKLDILYVHIL